MNFGVSLLIFSDFTEFTAIFETGEPAIKNY